MGDDCAQVQPAYLATLLPETAKKILKKSEKFTCLAFHTSKEFPILKEKTIPQDLNVHNSQTTLSVSGLETNFSAC